MHENPLTPKQVQQLVDTVAKDLNALNAYHALKDGPRYTDEQQQQLVDRIANSGQVASWVLVEIPWLTVVQKGQLKIVEAA